MTTKAETQKESMTELWSEMEDKVTMLHDGDLIEVTVLTVTRSRIWVDVAGITLGFVPEREYSSEVKSLRPGDKVMATIVALEDDQGNAVLSLKRAEREKTLFALKEKFDSGESLLVKVTEANRGGLMVEAAGVSGFLPVSQLAPSHYPKVGAGNKDEILRRLQELVGQSLSVKVITFDKTANKLIFSEKAASNEFQEERASKYKMGDKLKVKVTGVVDYGLFVDLGDGLEGLIHISEIAWERIMDLKNRFKPGDEIEAMVLSVDRGRVSLSVKRLTPDPWVEAAKKYKVGDKVKGAVTRVTPFGAFVKLDDVIDGLVHVSELADEKVVDPSQVVKTGAEYEFRIISIEPDTHRLGLSLRQEQTKKKAEEETEASKE